MNTRKTTLTVLLGLLVILLQSAQAPGQTPFYQKKTIQVVIGSAPGGLCDRWGRLDHRNQLSLWAGQTGRLDHRHVSDLHVLATTSRSPRGEIRRAKIQLARLAGKKGDDALHTRRFTLQIDRRHLESQRTAEMRRFRRN